MVGKLSVGVQVIVVVNVTLSPIDSSPVVSETVVAEKEPRKCRNLRKNNEIATQWIALWDVSQ